MAPKGPVDKATWQRISRSVDHVDKLYDLLANELNIRDDTAIRFVPIGDEVTEWRSILRQSKFLSNEKNELSNIHGEPLNDELVHISSILSQKRKVYYEKHLNGVNLENITTDCVIISQEEMQDSSSDDEEEP